jgi:sortase (surface protein transpeptidase)
MWNRLKEVVNKQLGFIEPRAFLWGLLCMVVLMAVISLVSHREASTESLDEINEEVVLQGEVMASSTPVRLRIPEINVDVPFSNPLGLDAGGVVEVPEGYEEVGWYKYGPTPGALGPAVVLGHVDSYTGPAVFFYLGQIKEGSDIYIDRQDGSTAHFKVTKMSRHNQNDFPTREVYGDLPYAGLRLITCTGIYDRENKRYTHNLIVYAKLVLGE